MAALSPPPLDFAALDAIVGGGFGVFDAACPLCGPDRRAPKNRARRVLRVWREDGGFASYACARCGSRGFAHAERGPSVGKRPTPKPATPKPPIDQSKVDFCKAAWAGSLPATGTIVERYLRSRGIFGPISPAVRFHPFMPLGYSKPGRLPAMVAKVVRADGELTGLRVTPLLSDGSAKALSNPSFIFLGPVNGGAIRLGDIPPNGALVVAEGVETALSFRDLTGSCVWSCLSASGLAAFDIPDAVRDLTIAADADDDGTGMDAALKLAGRVPSGCACRIISAPVGLDWNDVLEGSGCP